MDDNSRQRRKGPMSAGIDVANNVARIRQGTQLARAAATAFGVISANVWASAAIAIAIVIVVFALAFSGISAAGIPNNGPPPITEAGLSTIGASSGNAKCSIPSSGLCSVSSLSDLTANTDKKFADINIASKICQAESGGLPDRVNDHCLLPSSDPNNSDDYSVGLFQINMIGICTQAFSCFQLDPRKGRPCKDSAGNSTWCTIGNKSVLQDCVDKYTRISWNIQAALSLSSNSLKANGNSWTPWGTKDYCGIQ